ncbi:MAG: sulfatase-like hydrolase/transferase [Planctomycetota bacterium]|nr:sulfatase-like hydrolase/transferase [Planctomycetota bacterium]
MPKPNILLIMTDQQRWDTVGAAGGWVKTPNMDRLAAEGIHFVNCVSNSPVCVPTRLSMATGLYPHNTRVWNNTRHCMPSETPTWMQAIRNEGYRTSLFGKTHLHPHEGDLRDREDLMHAYGLDDVSEIGGPRASCRVKSHMTCEWEEKGLWDSYRDDFTERFSNRPHVVRPSPLGLENYYDVYVGSKASEYIEGYSRDEPWFCWVSFGGPHEPWDTPEPFNTMYAPEEMPPPVLPESSSHPRPSGRLDEMSRVQFEPDEELRLRADYAGSVTLIDDQIGRLLKTIEERDELQNTVIALVSDHGEMNGDYGLIYKSNFLNGAVRVPLIVRTPETASGQNAGVVHHSFVEWFDVGPTLTECAGGNIKHEQFGRSLCPVIGDPNRVHRTDAISELSGEIMIITDEWKLAINTAGEPYLLFDVQNDPDERNNLAGLSHYREIESSLRLRILDRVMQSQTRLDK